MLQLASLPKYWGISKLSFSDKAVRTIVTTKFSPMRLADMHIVIDRAHFSRTSLGRPNYAPRLLFPAHLTLPH